MSATVWEELVATALLGTERRPPERPQTTDGALARALDGLRWDDAEGALLGAAAIVTGFRAAGWQPLALEEPPSPAPADARRLCSPRANAMLAQLLDSGPAFLVPEWLRVAQEAGVRPAPELLPALLDAGVAGALRAAVLKVGGDPLRWLASLNDRWSWAAAGAVAGASTDERWQTGTRDERLELLRAVRSEDPARGRGLLASTWPADGAQERALLIQALALGLEPADEPFLEAALDDRSKPVRQQAAQLLAGLPSSALAARMAQRLRPLVDVGGRLRRKLQVKTPPEPDDGARRDGIDGAAPPHNLGAGAWRLAQMVGATPLALWQQITGEEPAATFALARGADHEPALKLGWALAARRQREPRWSAVLARETGDLQLLEALPPGAADEVALALLDAAGEPVTLVNVLDRIPDPWSPALSRAAIDHLARSLSRAGTVGGIGPLSHVALSLHLQARETAVAALQPLLQSDLPPSARRALDELLEVLDLRQTMTRELTSR